MPPPLMDGQVVYPDGTEATVSQMAKDVAVFLAWAAEPEHDDRKKVSAPPYFVCILSFRLQLLSIRRGVPSGERAGVMGS